VDLRTAGAEVAAEATGRTHRSDPILAGTGGPAGNARLTAWTGLVLLFLFAAELLTVIDVRQLISWHLVIGLLLIPPALLKTGTTGWRILRYYTGQRPYRAAGPPPMLLRLLGPLVVVFTLAVLGTGVALILLGPDAGRRSLLDLAGQRIDTVTLHQATFAGWAAVTGVHTVARVWPALRLTVLPTPTQQPVPGRYRRAAALAVTMLATVVTVIALVGAGSAWRSQPDRRPPHPHSTGR
jgi:hypothetical protein